MYIPTGESDKHVCKLYPLQCIGSLEKLRHTYLFNGVLLDGFGFKQFRLRIEP